MASFCQNNVVTINSCKYLLLQSPALRAHPAQAFTSIYPRAVAVRARADRMPGLRICGAPSPAVRSDPWPQAAESCWKEWWRVSAAPAGATVRSPRCGLQKASMPGRTQVSVEPCVLRDTRRSFTSFERLWENHSLHRRLHRKAVCAAHIARVSDRSALRQFGARLAGFPS